MIFKKLIDIGDDDLFAFLRVSNFKSIETLLRIDKIERYLMVLGPIDTRSKAERGVKEIDNEKLLYLLRNRQVDEFNKYVEEGVLIHLPFENLARCDLQNFHLKESMLFRADLSYAILSGADLSGANLSGANLFVTNLSYANLYQANLSEAHSL
ncbi:MAG: pentapeptide repeat-containing protein [Candidatus Nitrosopolaris sp.]